MLDSSGSLKPLEGFWNIGRYFTLTSYAVAPITKPPEMKREWTNESELAFFVTPSPGEYIKLVFKFQKKGEGDGLSRFWDGDYLVRILGYCLDFSKT